MFSITHFFLFVSDSIYKSEHGGKEDEHIVTKDTDRQTPLKDSIGKLVLFKCIYVYTQKYHSNFLS